MMPEPFFALSGYHPNAGYPDTDPGGETRPTGIGVPSLLRSLLAEHLDPGYAIAAAATAERRAGEETPRRLVTWGWYITGMLLVAGLFAIAASEARSLAPGVRSAQHLLAGNVRVAESVNDELSGRRDLLVRQVDELRRRQLNHDAEGARLLAELDRLGLAAANTALTGPGLVVTATEPGSGHNLSDASKQRISGRKQIILDRDLQLAVNSLWSAGAEAIAVGGIRMGPGVTIRQAGGRILVDNHPIGSPYLIEAVGAPQRLRDSFDRSPGLYRLRLLEVSYGVRVNVDIAEAHRGAARPGISIPAGATREVRFAEPLDEAGQP